MATSNARSASSGRIVSSASTGRFVSKGRSIRDGGTRARTTGPRTTARHTHPRYLIDNSVWARLSTDPDVVVALKQLLDLANPEDTLICPPIAAEVGFSARNGADHGALMEQLSSFAECSEHPVSGEVLEIQNKLWNGGLLRAAGATDTLIAAYALKNNAIVLHYDHDFDHIATVTPAFRHEWIVPRGSVA